ncbi:MAG: RNA ligase family protein [Deltaproteobacteria bacterium]|nr:RNA ligase family protein [Deltaproteobacteria bacterium]
MIPIRKYPRTHHLEGSRLQEGDEDLAAVRFAEIAGRPLVVEEKIDGQNAALSFDDDGGLLLQSRGHYLRGGAREKSFEPFKRWAATHAGALREVLRSRFVVYGEWCFAKHTVFYDALPHWFLEFDVYDRERDVFLSTPARRALLAGLPVASVPVLASAAFSSLETLLQHVGVSTAKTPTWRERLRESAARTRFQGGAHVDVERTVHETDPHDEMEGLYLKLEEGDVVVDRLKWVRASFLQAVVASDSHWFGRPIVENRLADGVDVYARRLS